MLWSSHKINHFVSIGFDDVDFPLVAILLALCFVFGKFAFFDASESRCELMILSMYSFDAAKIGVIAHEPTLWNVSCDNIIFGCCTDPI